MALSDSPLAQRERRVRTKPINAETNTRWSDKQKIDAANTYLALGNMALTARILGIPEITLRKWAATEWWINLIDDLKQQERLELSNKLKRMVEAAHAVVENRLVNGDPTMLKDGTIVSVPVKMRDAHRVAVDLLNQREVVEKKLGTGGHDPEQQDDKLKQLAEKFAEFATKKLESRFDQQRTIEVTDVIEVAQIDPVSDAVLSGDRLDGSGEMGEEGEDSPVSP